MVPVFIAAVAAGPSSGPTVLVRGSIAKSVAWQRSLRARSVIAARGGLRRPESWGRPSDRAEDGLAGSIIRELSGRAPNELDVALFQTIEPRRRRQRPPAGAQLADAKRIGRAEWVAAPTRIGAVLPTRVAEVPNVLTSAHLVGRLTRRHAREQRRRVSLGWKAAEPGEAEVFWVARSSVLVRAPTANNPLRVIQREVGSAWLGYTNLFPSTPFPGARVDGVIAEKVGECDLEVQV